MTDKISTPQYEGLKLFGRKWKVSVLVPNRSDLSDSNIDKSLYTAYVVSDSTKEERSLRVKFNIQKYGWITPNYSEISIYNLSPEDENIILKNGCRVIVEAGYVNGPYGLIYDAPIFQPIWSRKRYVDSVLTLVCIDADKLMYENHVEVTLKMREQRDLLVEMARKARKPFPINYISDSIKSNQLPRAKTFFGKPSDYLRQYAQQNGTHISVVDDNVYISMIQRDATTNPLELSPGEGGIIGTPQQTQDGVSLTVLLNSDIKIFKPQPMLIKINNNKIRVAKQTMGQLYSSLDKDGIYKVLGINHIGDTRGNDWYSHIVACSQSMEGQLASMFVTPEDISR